MEVAFEQIATKARIHQIFVPLIAASDYWDVVVDGQFAPDVLFAHTAIAAPRLKARSHLIVLRMCHPLFLRAEDLPRLLREAALQGRDFDIELAAAFFQVRAIRLKGTEFPTSLLRTFKRPEQLIPLQLATHRIVEGPFVGPRHIAAGNANVKPPPSLIGCVVHRGFSPKEAS
jgi:hypothetical protein